MNTDFVMMYLKNSLQKAFKSGGISFIEDLAEGLSVEQLSKFMEILKRVHDRKKNVIDCKVK
jgi:hypothetical protein